MVVFDFSGDFSVFRFSNRIIGEGDRDFFFGVGDRSFLLTT